ncbi:MAG: hypothetical protein WCL38_06790, partial [Actinomycetota bacterium]
STQGSSPPYVAYFGPHPDRHARVLFLPYPSTPPGLSSPLAWQATAGFTYSILGGYLAVPAPQTTASAFLVHPTGEEGALLRLGDSFGGHPISDRDLGLITLAMKHRHPTTVMVLPTFEGSGFIAATMTDIIGRLPARHGSVLVWRHVGEPRPIGRSVRQLQRCVDHATLGDVMAVPRCVVSTDRN